tara:strand:+ start:592 stop:759 length:168 start_codon:yes stop_codon:yes gene_type:complete
MKKLILILPFTLLASCGNNPPTGYNPGQMANAIRTMNEIQINTRVFNATGYNPHF